MDHSCWDFVGKAEFLSQFLQFFPCFGEVLLLSHVLVVVKGLKAALEFVVDVMIEGEHVSINQLQEMVQMSGLFCFGSKLSKNIILIVGHLSLKKWISFTQFALLFELSPNLASVVLPVVKFLDFL